LETFVDMAANNAVLLKHRKTLVENKRQQKPGYQPLSQQRLDERKCVLLNKKENWTIINEFE